MRIELDTVVEGAETSEDVANKMIEGLPGVTAMIETEQGPSGWPLIAYEGDEADLREVTRRYGGDTEETTFTN